MHRFARASKKAGGRTGRRAASTEADAARERRYKAEWDRKTSAHREQTRQASRDARYTAFRSLFRWGAVGAASTAALLSVFVAWRKDVNAPVEMVDGEATSKLHGSGKPAVQTHVPAGKRPALAAEKDVPAAERVRAEAAQLLELYLDETEGVAPQRKAVLLLNEMAGNRYASSEWEHDDPHAYNAREGAVKDVALAAKGDGLAVQPDDYVYLHFSHPEQPNLVYRETVKLDRDPIAPELRDAIVGAASDSTFSFAYDGGAKGAKGERVVHVQSHGDLLREMVDDVKSAAERQIVLETLRNRPY